MNKIIDNPETIQSAQEALDLIEQQEFTVKNLSKKEIKKLDKLRQSAMSDIEADGEVTKPTDMATASSVSLIQGDDEVRFVQKRVEELEIQGQFDKIQEPSQYELKMM